MNWSASNPDASVRFPCSRFGTVGFAQFYFLASKNVLVRRTRIIWIFGNLTACLRYSVKGCFHVWLNRSVYATHYIRIFSSHLFALMRKFYLKQRANVLHRLPNFQLNTRTPGQSWRDHSVTMIGYYMPFENRILFSPHAWTFSLQASDTAKNDTGRAVIKCTNDCRPFRVIDL